jgi:hypothetical protein
MQKLACELEIDIRGHEFDLPSRERLAEIPQELIDRWAAA